MDEIATPGIARKTGVRGGRPCIEGTGIRVTDIVTAVQLDYSRDEIADDFDISLQQVEAALTYYDRNTVAIDEDIKRQDENFEKHFKMGYGRPKTPILPR